MNQLRDPLLRTRLSPAPSPTTPARSSGPTILADFWPGIQLYYPPVKYAPPSASTRTWTQAAQRFRKHAWHTRSPTRCIFDLEDGCRQKEMSRELLRRELPRLPRKQERAGRGARQPVPHRRVREGPGARARPRRPLRRRHARQGGRGLRRAEIRDLSAAARRRSTTAITIQPIIEHPKSLKIAPELMQYATVKHVVFGIHDFSKAMGIQITPERLDRGAQVLPARRDVRGAHRRQGRDRRRRDADRPGGDAGEVRRDPRRAPLARSARRRRVARRLPARLRGGVDGPYRASR